MVFKKDLIKLEKMQNAHNLRRRSKVKTCKNY